MVYKSDDGTFVDHFGHLLDAPVFVIVWCRQYSKFGSKLAPEYNKIKKWKIFLCWNENEVLYVFRSPNFQPTGQKFHKFR